MLSFCLSHEFQAAPPDHGVCPSSWDLSLKDTRHLPRAVGELWLQELGMLLAETTARAVWAHLGNSHVLRQFWACLGWSLEKLYCYSSKYTLNTYMTKNLGSSPYNSFTNTCITSHNSKQWIGMLEITHWLPMAKLEVSGIISKYFIVWYSETQFQWTWSSWVVDRGSKAALTGL